MRCAAVGGFFGGSTPSAGAVTVLQNAPPSTSDAHGLYFIDFLLPGNSLQNEVGLLTFIIGGSTISTAPGTINLMGAGFFNGAAPAPSIEAFGNVQTGASGQENYYVTVTAWLDAGGVLQFSQLGGTLDDASGTYLGPGNGDQRFSDSGVFAGVDWTLPVTARFGIRDTSPAPGNPPVNIASWNAGNTKLILST